MRCVTWEGRRRKEKAAGRRAMVTEWRECSWFLFLTHLEWALPVAALINTSTQAEVASAGVARVSPFTRAVGFNCRPAFCLTALSLLLLLSPSARAVRTPSYPGSVSFALSLLWVTLTLIVSLTRRVYLSLGKAKGERDTHTHHLVFHEEQWNTGVRKHTYLTKQEPWVADEKARWSRCTDCT